MDIAAEAVQTIWQAANEAATGELATLRAEARHAASAAEAGARDAHDAEQADLAAERQPHAATQTRLEAGRAELEAAGRQRAELGTQFSTELERAPEQE